MYIHCSCCTCYSVCQHLAGSQHTPLHYSQSSIVTQQKDTLQSSQGSRKYLRCMCDQKNELERLLSDTGRNLCQWQVKCPVQNHYARTVVQSTNMRSHPDQEEPPEKQLNMRSRTRANPDQHWTCTGTYSPVQPAKEYPEWTPIAVDTHRHATCTLRCSWSMQNCASCLHGTASPGLRGMRCHAARRLAAWHESPDNTSFRRHQTCSQ